MRLVLSLVLVAEDVLVKNPHYAYCQTLEEGSWSWWLHGCALYDSALMVPVLGSLALAGLVAVLLRSMRQERTA